MTTQQFNEYIARMASNQTQVGIIHKFFELQDECMGYQDSDEMDKDEFERTYKTMADFVKEAKYIRSTFFDFEGDGTHVNAMLKEENPRAWRSMVGKLDRFIAKCEGFKFSGEA